LLPLVFETSVSTNSTTPAYIIIDGVPKLLVCLRRVNTNSTSFCVLEKQI